MPERTISLTLADLLRAAVYVFAIAMTIATSVVLDQKQQSEIDSQGQDIESLKEVKADVAYVAAEIDKIDIYREQTLDFQRFMREFAVNMQKDIQELKIEQAKREK